MGLHELLGHGSGKLFMKVRYTASLSLSRSLAVPSHPTCCCCCGLGLATHTLVWTVCLWCVCVCVCVVHAQDADGVANFPEDLVNPETNEPISSWYNPGQTWDTVFSSMASTYEECRAECVGVFLCVNERVLEIFGHTEDADEIIYANWLAMAYAGLRSLLYVVE